MNRAHCGNPIEGNPHHKDGEQFCSTDCLIEGGI